MSRQGISPSQCRRVRGARAHTRSCAHMRRCPCTHIQTHTQNIPSSRVLWCYFGISLPDAVLHENVAKSDVFRKVESPLSSLEEAGCPKSLLKFWSQISEGSLVHSAKNVCPLLLKMIVSSHHFGFTQYQLDCNSKCLRVSCLGRKQ